MKVLVVSKWCMKSTVCEFHVCSRITLKIPSTGARVSSFVWLIHLTFFMCNPCKSFFQRDLNTVYAVNNITCERCCFLRVLKTLFLHRHCEINKQKKLIVWAAFNVHYFFHFLHFKKSIILTMIWEVKAAIWKLISEHVQKFELHYSPHIIERIFFLFLFKTFWR